MKTNPKSSRPTQRFSITVNNQPYGLVSAANWFEAAKIFHILTHYKHDKVENEIGITEVTETVRTYGIYYREREFAKQMGDPLLATINARSKEEAEERAYAMHINSQGAGLWAWPINN